MPHLLGETAPLPAAETDYGLKSCSPERQCLFFGVAHFWQFVPGSAVEHPAAGFRRAPAPLLVEVGNAFGNTPIPSITNPARAALPVAGATLPASNDPLETVNVELVHRIEQVRR